MNFKKILKENIFHIINKYYKYKALYYPNEKIESMLRGTVHAIEKGFVEKDINYECMINARVLFYECLKRKLLSADEIYWCENILFGKVRYEKSRKLIEKSFSDNYFCDVLKLRRSMRSWQAGGRIEEREFERLVDAARWAPSSCNRQPWHFLLTHDKNKIDYLSQARSQSFIKGAPSCILVLINLTVYPKEAKYYFAYLDAGAAIQNMLLMAENIGLGACWVNFAPSRGIENYKKRIRQMFAIPAVFDLVSIIPIGKMKNIQELVKPPGRKEIADIIHYEIF